MRGIYKTHLWRLGGAALSLLLPGCVVLGLRDDLAYQKGPSSVSGPFAPDVYVEKQTRRFHVPFFRVDLEQPPHDLVLLTFDQTFEQTSEPFTRFVVDALQIQYVDEAPIAIVSPKMPLSERSFTVAKDKEVFGEKANHTFAGAIPRSASFVLDLAGYAERHDGERLPFHRKAVYIYNGRDWTCWTLMQELAGA